MAHYDLVRGWIGLTDHQIIDLTSPGVSVLEKYPQIVEFLASAGIEPLTAANDVKTLEIAAIRFDKFLVARVKSSPASGIWLRKNPSMWRRMLFVMVSSGSVTITGDGASYVSNDGNIIIVFPGSTPATISVKEPAEFVTFSFDESASVPTRLTPENIADIESSSCIFQSTHAYLSTLVSSSMTSRLDDSPSMRALTRSMAQALTSASIRPDAPNDTFTRARQLITSQCGNPLLSPSTVAEDLGVSRRSLYRAFSDNETTVAQELLAARTSRALELLRGNPDLPTRLLVERSGFSSETSLRRALRSRSSSSLADLRESLRLDKAT